MYCVGGCWVNPLLNFCMKHWKKADVATYRNVAVGGGLILLTAETLVQRNSLFAGVPKMGDDNKPKSLMQLCGRVLIVLMFASLFRLKFTPIHMLELAVGGVLMAMIAVGYKTKLSALVLVVWLSALNGGYFFIGFFVLKF